MERAKLTKPKQRFFMKAVFNKLRKSDIKLLSGQFGVSSRTIRDWYRAKYLIPVDVIRDLAKIAKLKPPEFQVVDQYWYVAKGAKKAGQMMYKLHGRVGGDLESWRKKWQHWWETKGRFSNNKSPILERKFINKPNLSEDLAEMIGVILGDGGITKTQVVITLHYKLDAEFADYVTSQLHKLFGVRPSVIKRDNVFQIIVSRTNLIEYLMSLELKIGNKVRQQVSVPDWIQSNIKYSTACLRGLFDTDGCVFKETHRLSSGTYSYLRWSFTNHSLPIRDFVFETLCKLGFNVRIRNKFRVQIENKEQIEYYFKVVGSNNPKHVRRAQGRVG